MRNALFIIISPFSAPGWFHQFRQSWLLQLATSLLLPARTSWRTSKSRKAHQDICYLSSVSLFNAQYKATFVIFIISEALRCNIRKHFMSFHSFLVSLKRYLFSLVSSSLHRHWLTSAYIVFAVPYFMYDIYAMFMCYWYKLRVKGHEEASAAPQNMSTAMSSYLRREFLMVLHHVVMVTVCFPVSVVTGTHCY